MNPDNEQFIYFQAPSLAATHVRLLPFNETNIYFQVEHWLLSNKNPQQ